MEDKDKEALYQVQKLLPQSQRIRAFFDIEFLAPYLDVHPEHLLMEGPALFVSRPKTQRLLYKWHSEAHYYPKRRKFLNLWFPIYTDRTAENGAMHLKVGSHKETWDFAEWDSGPNTFKQYEIPADWVKDYPTYVCESKRGDLIVFDRNLVHTSVENTSDDYAFAVVARVWSPRDDLTLSGNMAATPYGGDIGRAGLVVQR
jgi:ectoine hydroxylase-related dioxygenase (phytanoyl-CoA dioxygenase family)